MTGSRAYPRRSPLSNLPEYGAARWHGLGDAAVAASLPGATGKPSRLVIADLSALPRIGFKGRGTIEAMKKRGVTIEAVPNRAFRQSDGGLCLVLAPSEVIVLSNLDGNGANLDRWLLQWRLEDEERTYPLLRQDSHAWLTVAGEAAPAMFAKICSIDLRPHKFSDLSIAQTSVAKTTAIIVRADLNNRLCFHVLADSAAALYFCRALLDAAGEFGGRIVGLRDIQDS